MEASVEIGRTSMTVGETLELRAGAIVMLERLAGEPVDLLVNGTLIARGEVVVVDDQFGLRISEIVEDDLDGEPAARRHSAAASCRSTRRLPSADTPADAPGDATPLRRPAEGEHSSAAGRGAERREPRAPRRPRTPCAAGADAQQGDAAERRERRAARCGAARARARPAERA